MKCPWCNGKSNGPRLDRSDCGGVRCNHECHKEYEESLPVMFPWPMDNPIEELERIAEQFGMSNFVYYLLTRLKKAESERDEWKSSTEFIMCSATILGEGKAVIKMDTKDHRKIIELMVRGSDESIDCNR